MNSESRLAIVCICLALIALNGCVTTHNSSKLEPPLPSTIPQPQDAADSWWEDRHEVKKRQALDQSIDILMIGDSITHGWETTGLTIWNRYYAPRNGFNIGFSGDRTENVLWRIRNGAVDNMQPKVVVLMIGTNNTGARLNYPASHTSEGIKSIVSELRRRLPNTRILLLAILPRNLMADDEMRQRNDAVNLDIEKLKDGENIFFLNINKVFVHQNGQLNTDLMPDLVHPSTEGYRRWAAAMEPVLNDLMNMISP